MGRVVGWVIVGLVIVRRDDCDDHMTRDLAGDEREEKEGAQQQ
jgi:hypothetical protein